MKALDRLIRAWRTRVALAAAPKAMTAVLDIGCGDGYLLRRLDAGRRDGIDPTLDGDVAAGGMRLCRGLFPNDLGRLSMTGPYDAIFALAVFEHLEDADLRLARERIPDILMPGGRLIVSVPHPFVDRILDVLMFLRLIDGQAVHEHHGFDPERLRELCSDRLGLVAMTRFQWGLNHLFVFERL